MNELHGEPVGVPRHELEGILGASRDIWKELRGARVFLTGGTGFFGLWLLESLLFADARLGLGARVVVLTRDADSFRRRRPRLAGSPAVSILSGDVRSFPFPDGAFSHVLHAASSTDPGMERQLMFDTIVQGTRRVLEFARRAAVPRLLFVSSGAVYGAQPAGVSGQPEAPPGVPGAPGMAAGYAEGKRIAESLCADESRRGGLEAKIARCFAFVGPGLPLNGHFAIGNFIRDALSGRPVEIRGDGTPVRSYLYGADLATWLWTILCRGASCRPYNVGSERRLTIRETAETVVRVLRPDARIRVLEAPSREGHVEQYVPCTMRARTELNLRETVALEEAIRRTARWSGAVS